MLASVSALDKGAFALGALKPCEALPVLPVGFTLQIAIRAVHVKSPVEFHSQKPDTGVGDSVRLRLCGFPPRLGLPSLLGLFSSRSNNTTASRLLSSVPAIFFDLYCLRFQRVSVILSLKCGRWDLIPTIPCHRTAVSRTRARLMRDDRLQPRLAYGGCIDAVLLSGCARVRPGAPSASVRQATA